MNGHEMLAHTLKSLGVTHVYSLSGGSIRESLPACSQVGLRIIGVRHQQAAVLMAAAHNYRSGRLTAVAIVSAGPAVTNTTTGILVARDNCWPVIVLAGTYPYSNSRLGRTGTFQALDGVCLFQSITKWSTKVSSSARISQTLVRGFQEALSGQPGPVYLEIPEEILTGTVSRNVCSFPDPLPAEDVAIGPIVQASQILLGAKRPAVILGRGLRWAEPYEELRALIEDYQIPFITSPMGRGFLPDDHPLCFNMARDDLQQKADAMLLLGLRLNWTFRYGRQFARNAKLIHIDVAQEELVDIRPGSIRIRGNLKYVIPALLGQINVQNPKIKEEIDCESWLKSLRHSREKNTQTLNKKMNVSSLPMTPHRLMKELRDFLPRNAICVLDGRDTMAAAQEVLCSYEPASRFTAGTNGCMGIGIPFGIGAKLSAPDRMVVVVTGDMAFGIAAMELETAVRQKIPIIVVLVNNDGGCGATVQKKLYPTEHELVAKFQEKIPYEKIMEAFGGYAESIDRPEQVHPALNRAVHSGLPACLNVFVDPYAPFENYLG